VKVLAPSISVVIPTKDEEDAIAAIVADCKKSLEGVDHEVIVVDASTDNTPTQAIRAGAKLVKQIGQGGVGQALTQGFYWARGEYIAFFDGDGTYDPKDLHRIVEPLLSGEADLVNGNRFADIEKGAMTITNRVGNHILTWVGNLFFTTRIKDSQSGMKAFRKDVFRRMSLSERGFPFCSEILGEASKLNLRIVEVGISYRRRIGKSKLKPAFAGPAIFWASIKMLRDYDPLLLFTGIGLVLLAVGFYTAWPVVTEYVTQGTFRMLGRALVSIFCWFTGILSIFTGFILDSVNYTVKRMETRLTAES
jgi:glycosyltransferase involved in cell wall biosynthesis